MPLDEPVLEPIPAAAPEKRIHGNKGKKATDKQLENLRKGMEIMKAKREEQKKKKEEKKAKIKAGEVVEDSSEDEAPPLPKPKKEEKPVGQKKRMEVLGAVEIAPARVRKPRAESSVSKEPKPPRNYATRDDFEAFKTSILDTIKSTPMIKEVEKPVERVVEKPVEKVVEKTKVLTGSDLLNAIFFK